MNSSSDASEKEVERFLLELGLQGLLDSQLTDDDYDKLMANAAPAALSPDFMGRALAAMAQAQATRENREPARALGSALARARIRRDLAIASVAQQAGVSARALMALEGGQLPIRDLLDQFPPSLMRRFLGVIRFEVTEFSNRVIAWSSSGGGATGSVGLTYRQQGPEGPTMTEQEVGDYLLELEQH